MVRFYSEGCDLPYSASMIDDGLMNRERERERDDWLLSFLLFLFLLFLPLFLCNNSPTPTLQQHNSMLLFFLGKRTCIWI
jgi:hypothetical protein